MTAAIKVLQHFVGPAFLFCGLKPHNDLFKLRKSEGNGEHQNMENDFVLVMPGLIISIECKATLDNKQFRKVCTQWARLRQVLEEELGLGCGFKFVKCLAYQNTGRGYEVSEACSNCQPYLLKFESQQKFVGHFQNLISKERPPPDEKTGGGVTTAFFREHNSWHEIMKDIPLNIIQFRDVVRDLLIFTSKESDASDIETRVSDAFSLRHAQFINTPAKSVFFWDPDQYEILKQEAIRRQISGGEHFTRWTLKFV